MRCLPALVLGVAFCAPPPPAETPDPPSAQEAQRPAAPKPAPAQRASDPAANAATTSAPEEFAFDALAPAVGQWVGTLTPATGQTLFTALRVSLDAAGKPLVDVLHTMGHCRATEVTLDGPRLGLTFTWGTRTLSLTGEVAQGGQGFAGTATAFEGRTPGPPFSVLLRREPRVADLAEPRTWVGTIQLKSKETPMSLTLARTPGGRLVVEVDLAARDLAGAPLVDVRLSNETLRATWPAKPPVVLELGFGEKGRTLNGNALLPNMTNPVKLTRDTAPAPAVAAPAEPR